MKTLSENISFGGVQGVYSHASDACKSDMTFAVYMPNERNNEPVPVLWYLSGLTCTHENAMTKAMLQSHAAKHRVAIVFPDTSPRGEGVADHDDYDLGQGAGFYVNATQDPWAAHFRMYDYIADELPKIVARNFNIDMERQGITGHSMGGHGALTIAMTRPGQYKSLSAFAPIANPTASDWGRKQLSAYLGDDVAAWADHDASECLRNHGWAGDILIDQGGADQFLDLLRPAALSAALMETNTAHVMRLQPGYDHSYFFVASFGGDHLNWHAARLWAANT